MKITAKDLKEVGLIDDVIAEPVGGAHLDWKATADAIKKVFLADIVKYSKEAPEKIAEERYQKFRAFGQFLEK
jgi:acetyl-CoA carboxylase carboxyl transferase subunit alpha